MNDRVRETIRSGRVSLVVPAKDTATRIAFLESLIPEMDGTADFVILDRVGWDGPVASGSVQLDPYAYGSDAPDGKLALMVIRGTRDDRPVRQSMRRGSLFIVMADLGDPQDAHEWLVAMNAGVSGIGLYQQWSVAGLQESLATTAAQTDEHTPLVWLREVVAGCISVAVVGEGGGVSELYEAPN